MKKYFRIWCLFLSQAAQVAFASRFGAVLFIIGKILRFGSFILLLVLLSARITQLAGYSMWEVALVFMTFSLIDAIPQFLFREVYRFRSYVVSGDFDYFLTKPISPLFRALLGGSDVLDIPTMLLYCVGIFFVMSHLSFSTAGLLLYMVLFINGILIASAFHIAILSLGIITTEVDNVMWFFRDITSMGRFPVSIYQQPIQAILTFIIPVGIMITFPVNALVGSLTPLLVVLSLCIGGLFLWGSLSLWQYSLRFYTSASS